MLSKIGLTAQPRKTCCAKPNRVQSCLKPIMKSKVSSEPIWQVKIGEEPISISKIETLGFKNNSKTYFET